MSAIMSSFKISFNQKITQFSWSPLNSITDFGFVGQIPDSPPPEQGASDPIIGLVGLCVCFL